MFSNAIDMTTNDSVVLQGYMVGRRPCGGCDNSRQPLWPTRKVTNIYSVTFGKITLGHADHDQLSDKFD